MLSNVDGEKFVCYHPQTKKGNVFTPVCDSVHRGVYTPIPPGRHPQGRHLPRQTPPGRHPSSPWQTPPFPWQTPLFSPGRHPPTLRPQTATTADGTHLTGMHSCCSGSRNECDFKGLITPVEIDGNRGSIHGEPTTHSSEYSLRHETS